MSKKRSKKDIEAEIERLKAEAEALDSEDDDGVEVLAVEELDDEGNVIKVYDKDNPEGKSVGKKTEKEEKEEPEEEEEEEKGKSKKDEPEEEEEEEEDKDKPEKDEKPQQIHRWFR